MNAARRKEITRAIDLLAEAREIISACHDEEREYFDNMPESFKEGDKGTTAEAAADALEEAVGGIEEAEDTIRELSA